MKKIFLLLSCFFTGFIFSQEYHFDYKCYDIETQLKGNYRGNKRTNIVYFNSENKDVIAYDYFFSQESKRSFLLYDYNVGILFSYSINQDGKFSSLNLEQKYPIKIYRDEKEIERIEIESIGQSLWSIKAFPTKKSNKVNLELKILIQKTNFPMPNIRFMDLTPNIHSKIYTALLSKLDSKNYRIVDVITDYRNGVIMHDDFSKCEKVNLKFLTSEKPN